MRVLVVDDDREIRQVVRRALEHDGFEVLEAESGEEALGRSLGTPIELAVIDLWLPGMTGLELLGELRASDPAVHVTLLTCADAEDDRVSGLMAGADDYVVKPFFPRELAARMTAVRRRLAADGPTMIDVDGLRIETTTREVKIGDEPLTLTRREYDLLCHLAAHPGKVFSRAELLEAVWGSSDEWQSPATVTEHVRRLRRKVELDPANPLRITTVRGVGYRFHPSSTSGRASRTPTLLGPVPRAADPSERAFMVLVGTEIVHANDAARHMVGPATASEVLASDATEGPFLRALRGSVHGRAAQGPAGSELTFIRRDDREVLIEIEPTPVVWKGESATRLELHDLSRDTDRLRELATGIRTDVSDAVIVTDAALRIQSFNSAAEELYGWSEEEVLGLVTFEVLPWMRDDAAAGEARSLFQSEGRWHGEVTQRRRDGSTVRTRSSVTLLRDSSGCPIGVVTVCRRADPAARGQVVPSRAPDHALASEIHRGLDRGEFAVYYQPVVRLADETWCGAEALVRWRHPDRGLLAPDLFIEAAERSGAIVELGHFVLDEACRQWSTWHAGGHDLHMSVNLSGRQLADPALVSTIRTCMSDISMTEGKLWLEVTETSLVDHLDRATTTLARAAALGASIVIDDFGTGWASLTYLRSFPVDALKMDRLFVGGLGTPSADEAIIRSVISLGDELGLSVIAEGIETPEQADRLRRLGCELGQGFLFGRPELPEVLDIGASGTPSPAARRATRAPR